MDLKEKLIKQLGSSKVRQAEDSETAFYFTGRCGNLHLIETNVNESIGMKSGQTIRIPVCIDCDSCSYNAIFIGTGVGCEDGSSNFDPNDKGHLWVLKEDKTGVFYLGDCKTIAEVKERLPLARLL